MGILNGFPLRVTHPNAATNMLLHGPLIQVEIADPSLVVMPPAPGAPAGAVPVPGAPGTTGPVPVTPPVVPAAAINAGFALIDTGATETSIDAGVAQALGLVVTGPASGLSASGTYTANKYATAWRNVGGNTWNVAPMTGLPLAPQGLIMLIGRDVLSRCVFHYNGSTGTFSLSW